MGRPKTAHPKTVSITVKMTPEEAAVLDQRRKSLGRSTYLRWLAVQGGHPHPDPVVPPLEPEPAPVPSPITPPAPPGPPIETAKRHLHRYKKAGEPVEYRQAVPYYRQKCACGDTRVAP